MSPCKSSRHELSAPRSSAQSGTSGFTLLELTISLTLASMIFVAVWQVFSNTSDVVSMSLENSTLETARSSALQRMKEEIRDSGQGTSGFSWVLSHSPQRTTTSNSITFSNRIAFEGLMSDWSVPITYRLGTSLGETPDNGIDDDGDGLVDERTLIRRQLFNTETLIDNVERISFERQAQSNLIRVTLGIYRRASTNANEDNIDVRTIRIALRNT